MTKTDWDEFRAYEIAADAARPKNAEHLIEWMIAALFIFCLGMLIAFWLGKLLLAIHSAMLVTTS